MKPAHARCMRMLLGVALLKAFPGFLVKVKHDSIASGLNYRQQAAHHHAAGEQITYSESHGKV